MASNPVFSRIERETERGYAGFGNQGPQSPPPASGWPSSGQMTDRQLQDLYERPAAGAVQTGRLTLDDVVMKTAGLFTLMLVFAAVGWVLTPQVGPVLLLGGIALTLVLGFAIALKKTISVPLIVVYAVVEGLLVGSISAIYATRYEGIVTQAVLATLSVFAGMLLAYKVGLIKVTARFRRMVTMAIFGYMIFALVNLGYALVMDSSRSASAAPAPSASASRSSRSAWPRSPWPSTSTRSSAPSPQAHRSATRGCWRTASS